MDILALKQKLGELCDKQQEIVNKAVTESRAMTEQEDADFKALQKDIDGLTATIKVAEEVEARNQGLNQPTNTPPRPTIPGERGQTPLDDGGFHNIGEFLDAVRFGDSQGRLKEARRDNNGAYQVPEAFRARLFTGIRNEWSMGEGAGGGFAVPEQFSSELLMVQPEGSIIRPRSTVIPAGDPPDAKLTIPAFHQGADGVFGGVEVYWTAEGGEKPETNGNLKETSLEPKEVSAITVVTDKLLRNWQAANTFITFLLRGAMVNAEDLAFIKGNGVGKPLGVINSPGAMVIKRSTSAQIEYIDVVNMLAALFPAAVNGAVFLASQSALPQIATIKDENGNYIFIRGDATRGIPSTLMGIPIIFTGKVSALGNKGDLTLLAPQYYLIKDGSGPYVAASEHVYFRNNKTVIKCFWNVDGQGWVDEPITLEDGSTQVSAYVVLE
ncbi:MAG: phage major capsid protein [Syntrophomonas sp.]